ncbi:hypothetical protein ACH5RR_027582 [Cinchona calisaya]|uniref:Uncharacterized protein n=1 Tax=Cinchona calisaya TaxID=153742 RepID=A0ABD2Z5X6_9GENT
MQSLLKVQLYPLMMQMMNAEINYNGVVIGGVAIPFFKQGNGGIGLSSCNKQPPGAAKKTALRDVQNQPSGLAQNHQENSSFLAGGADADGVRVCGNKRLTPECPSGTHHQQMMEQYIHLQKLLKECDESNCRNYIQLLQHLSPAELSRHAFEVEARATQLEMEEGKEMHRMKALNILGVSTLTDNSLQTTSTLTSIHCNLVEE